MSDTFKPKKIDSKIVYNSPWLTVRAGVFQEDGPPKTYHFVERADSVVIIPLTPKKNTVLLRHFRYPIQSYSWEFPMGAIEQDETPEQAAARELLEETRLEPGSLTQIGVFHSAPGLTPQRVTVFVAEINEKNLSVARIPGGEIQEFKILPFSKIEKMVINGIIQEGFTLISFLFEKLHLNQKLTKF